MKGTRYEPGSHDGEHVGEEEDEHGHEAPEVEVLPYEARQAGLYAQMVFRFHKAWRIGARWDRLNNNRVIRAGVPLDVPGNLDRYGFMMDYSPTEFSRIRLQYNINRYHYFEEERKNYNELILQFNLAIGAHGEHSF
jgi:hypothetical protein